MIRRLGLKAKLPPGSDPSKSVFDAVLSYRPQLGGVHVATIFNDHGELRTVLTLENPFSERIHTFSCSLETKDIRKATALGGVDQGRYYVWYLEKLAPSVYKIFPSIFVDGAFHAYITIVDVPEPAPWEAP